MSLRKDYSAWEIGARFVGVRLGRGWRNIAPIWALHETVDPRFPTDSQQSKRTDLSTTQSCRFAQQHRNPQVHRRQFPGQRFSGATVTNSFPPQDETSHPS